MNNMKAVTGCFAQKAKRLCVNIILLICAVNGLSGCTTSKKTQSLAISPPEFRFTTLYHKDQTAEILGYLSKNKGGKETLSAEEILLAVSGISPTKQPNLDYQKKEIEGVGCRFKDRFDRKALLAYEWDRNRVELDVDDLNMQGSSDEFAIKIEYRLRLQPEKTKSEKCRFNSPWQGLIGSGYNEFFVREEDTVYEDVKEFKHKLQTYFD